MSMDSVMGSQLLASLSNISQSSSPRMDCDQLSIKSDDEQQSSSSSKVKLMCSYGGRIMPRPHDSQLRYIGGETRILVVPRSISYSDLCLRLAKLCSPGQGGSVFPKYKLPYEDYDALVSVISDEDLGFMFEEYDRLGAREAPSKLRLFVFPRNPSVSPAPSFDPAKGDREQSFLEALNSSPIQQQIQQQIHQIQQQQSGEMFFDGPAMSSSAQQEVIVDAPGASACSSSSSALAVQKIIEADSALLSDLPPILTDPKKKPSPRKETPVSANPVPPTSPVSSGPLELDQLINPQLQQAQRIIAIPPQQQLLVQQQVSQLAPIQPPQPQILPPRGPKPKVSSPQDQNKEKAKIEAGGSPNMKAAKAAMELEPSAVAEALQKLKVGEVNRGEKIVDRAEEQGILIGGDNPKNFEFELDPPPTAQIKYGSIDGQEISLDAFMQAEKLKQQQQAVFVQPQQFQAQIQGQAPAQQYFQQQQPYIIENNMIYYLATDPVAGAHQMQPQPVQFIQRPMMHPMQFQRGGSGPLVARQQPPLQRQVSAAFMEQFQRPQQAQQQQQQQLKGVLPVTRMGPGVQSPSRFRDQMPVMVPGNLAQQQQQQGIVRNMVDPSFVTAPAAALGLPQQMPTYTAAP